MPVLAGWITGEQVPPEVIEQTLAAMGTVLEQHGGDPARTAYPGAGLIAFSDTAYAMQHNDEQPVLDWTPERRTLVYRRPLSGLHPLYYITDWPSEGNLLFASEIKALFAVGVPRRLHLAALDALARYGFIPAPWTAFKDIQVVPAGSILRWQRAKTVLNHAIDYHLSTLLDPAPNSDALHSLLDTACTHILPPHDDLLALVDPEDDAASLTALLAAQHTTTPFRIASLDYHDYTKSKQSHRWDAVERVAEATQSELLLVQGTDQMAFWPAVIACTETPALDTRSLMLHQLLHTTAVETGARVALCGVGAHALLGPSTHILGKEAAPEETLARYRQFLLGPSESLSDRTIWSHDAYQALQDTQESWEDTLHARKLERTVAQLPSWQERIHYLDMHLRLPDYLVSPLQQLALQEHMAIRSPYLGTKTLDILTRLPLQWDQDTPREQVLNHLLQRYLPGHEADLVRQPGWIAQDQVAAHDIQSELLQQMLSEQQLTRTGLFDPQAVELLRQQCHGQRMPRELLLVFTTQLLCELFQVEGW